MAGGLLSPLMLTAGAGMLQNQGLGPNLAFVALVDEYQSLAPVSQLAAVVSAASGVLSGSTVSSTAQLGASSFPFLTNAIPTAFVANLSVIISGGSAAGDFTNVAIDLAEGLTGDGDNSILAQIYNSAAGYAGTANQFINSNRNSGSLAATFGPVNGGMDNVTTGSVSQVSEALGALGSDLDQLGNTIDLANLEDLGLPSTLVRQLAVAGGLTGAVQTALRQAGLDQDTIISFAAVDFVGISDTANRLLYQAMTGITGDDLDQVKAILGVTTPAINTMADLLDPAKIMPESYLTLTTPTPNGLRGIYRAPDTVNTNLERYFI